MQEIDIGAMVFDGEGRRVGHVIELRAEQILIEHELPHRGRVRLPIDAVAQIHPDRIELNTTIDIDDPETNGDSAEPVPASPETSPAPSPTRPARKKPPAAHENGHDHLTAQESAARPAVDTGLQFEELRIERRPVELAVTDESETDYLFEEFEIEIPVRGERPVVRKRAVVREEVRISKNVRRQAG